MQKMQNQKPQEVKSTENDRASPLPTQASSVISPTAPAAGGVKKKKPKKKK
jgi:hypothetical protein